jgi:hypothetical protein
LRNVPARRRADHPGLAARPAKLIGNSHYNFASSLGPGRSAGVDSRGNEFTAALTLTTSNSAIILFALIERRVAGGLTAGSIR